MKKKNIAIIAIALIIVLACVGLFVLSKNKSDEPVSTQAQSSSTVAITEKEEPDITLALSEYRAFINWKKDDSAAGYYVYYDDGSGWAEYGKTDKNTFRSKGLKGGTSYTFGIKPYTLENGDEKLSSDMLYTIKGNTLPDTPKVTAEKSGSSYSLKWDKVNNAKSYFIYTSVDGEKWTKIDVTQNTSYTFTDKNNEKLFVAVRALREADGEKYLSDYVKTLVDDSEKSGVMYSYGDSIATGVGSHSYSYANIFAEEHNLKLINKATTGSQLSSSDPSKDHISENIIKDVSSDCDYIFIEGGNNDYYFGSQLGEVSESGSNFDINTTCGALESALSYLKKTCPDAKIVFIIIHNAGGRAEIKNDLGLTFTDYADGIRAVCEKYGVAVADCLAQSGFNTSDTALSDKYTHKFNGVFPTGDGVHPTEQAYREFYMPLIEKAVK